MAPSAFPGPQWGPVEPGSWSLSTAVPHPPSTTTATNATIGVRSDLDRSEPAGTRRIWGMSCPNRSQTRSLITGYACPTDAYALALIVHEAT